MARIARGLSGNEQTKVRSDLTPSLSAGVHPGTYSVPCLVGTEPAYVSVRGLSDRAGRGPAVVARGTV